MKLILAGLFLHIISLVLNLLGIELFHVYFYFFAWWSFILILEGINLEMYKESLMFPNFKKFINIALSSSFLWLVFELLNFRVKNWSYHNVPLNIFILPFGFLCYATVIPAIVDISKILDFFVRYKTVRYDFIRKTSYNKNLSLLVGFSSLVLLLLYPTFFFPFMWLCFIFICEPWNDFILLKNRQKIVSLGISALICGIFWEFWNWLSGAHWRYEIPFFSKPKIFQMPLLGYLGFVPFGVEIYSMYILLMKLMKKIDKYKLIFYIFYFIFCVISLFLIAFKNMYNR